MNQAVEVSAIGKAISSKNARSLKKAIETILELLVDTKALNETDIEELSTIGSRDKSASEETEPEEKPEPEKKPESEEVKEEEPVAASSELGEPLEQEIPEEFEEVIEKAEIPVEAMASLKETIERTSWAQRLRTTIDLFHVRFRDLNMLDDKRLKNMMSLEPTRRESEIEATVKDLDSILASLRRDRPATSDTEWFPDFPMMCSAESGESATAIAFDFPIEAASEEDPNRHPVQGVLFRIDEPSEAIPAIGPGLPLLIPKDVAESVLNSVSGLPLDAHDKLDRHANAEIAGVMQAASIQGNDFVVSGLLWPWSQGKKVQAISKDASRLGMSMNAIAKGVPALHNGTKVFKIEKLRLMGANILYSDKATYRKTRLIAAQEFVPGGDGAIAIAASADSSDPVEKSPEPVQLAEDTSPTQRNPKMDDEIKLQLAALSVSVNDTVKNLGSTVIALNNDLETLRDELREVRRDYESRQAAIQAAEREKTEQSQFERLSQEIQAAVAKAVNPTGAPARKTYPISANSANGSVTSPERMQYELQLAAVRGELTAFQSLPAGQYDGVKVMELIDKQNLLQAQIANCG